MGVVEVFEVLIETSQGIFPVGFFSISEDLERDEVEAIFKIFNCSGIRLVKVKNINIEYTGYKEGVLLN